MPNSKLFHWTLAVGLFVLSPVFTSAAEDIPRPVITTLNQAQGDFVLDPANALLSGVMATVTGDGKWGEGNPYAYTTTKTQVPWVSGDTYSFMLSKDEQDPTRFKLSMIDMNGDLFETGYFQTNGVSNDTVIMAYTSLNTNIEMYVSPTIFNAPYRPNPDQMVLGSKQFTGSHDPIPFGGYLVQGSNWDSIEFSFEIMWDGASPPPGLDTFLTVATLKEGGGAELLAAVPEPATLGLVFSGCLALLAWHRRQKIT